MKFLPFVGDEMNETTSGIATVEVDGYRLVKWQSVEAVDECCGRFHFISRLSHSLVTC